MKTSEKTGKLMAAMRLVQAEVPLVHKDGTVKIDGQGSGRIEHFASHEESWRKLQPVLARHGLTVSQDGEPGVNGSQWLVTRITWVGANGDEEQWKEGRMLVASPRPGFRDFGAFWSYCRRISLLASLGIVAGGDEPDQGEADKAFKEVKPPRADRAARPAGASRDGEAEARRVLAELAELPSYATHAQIADLSKQLSGLQFSEATREEVARAFAKARAERSR